MKKSRQNIEVKYNITLYKKIYPTQMRVYKIQYPDTPHITKLELANVETFDDAIMSMVNDFQNNEQEREYIWLTPELLVEIAISLARYNMYLLEPGILQYEIEYEEIGHSALYDIVRTITDDARGEEIKKDVIAALYEGAREIDLEELNLSSN